MRNKILMALGFVFCAGFVQAGQEVGNGGGGLERNGNVLTFGSANVQLKDIRNPFNELPGLDLALDAIQNMPVLERTKKALHRRISPGKYRKYARISSLPSPKEAELRRTYFEAVRHQIPADEIRVFAVTARENTYLLPEFFQLKEIEQAAILFHEALWALDLDRKLDYARVIDAEIKFQNYLIKSNGKYEYDKELFMALDSVFGPEHLSVVYPAAIMDDERAGRLASLTTEGGYILLSDLISDKGITSTEYPFKKQCPEVEVFGTTKKLRALTKRYPDMKFLKVLSENSDRLTVCVETSAAKEALWSRTALEDVPTNELYLRAHFETDADYDGADLFKKLPSGHHLIQVGRLRLKKGKLFKMSIPVYLVPFFDLRERWDELNDSDFDFGGTAAFASTWLWVQEASAVEINIQGDQKTSEHKSRYKAEGLSETSTLGPRQIVLQTTDDGSGLSVILRNFGQCPVFETQASSVSGRTVEFKIKGCAPVSHPNELFGQCRLDYESDALICHHGYYRPQGGYLSYFDIYKRMRSE